MSAADLEHRAKLRLSLEAQCLDLRDQIASLEDKMKLLETHEKHSASEGIESTRTKLSLALTRHQLLNMRRSELQKDFRLLRKCPSIINISDRCIRRCIGSGK